MNKIWLYIVLLSSLILIYTNPSIALPTMIQSASECITLCLELCAVYAIWLGILQILEDSGLSDKLAKFLSPIVKRLFKIEDKEAIKLISVAISANFLGLGNASTPAGIKAMERLDDKSGKISYAMIMFMVLSSCSIQILPTTIMGLRASAGSGNPADIILPTLISSIIATSSGVFLTYFISKRREKNRY